LELREREKISKNCPVKFVQLRIGIYLHYEYGNHTKTIYRSPILLSAPATLLSKPFAYPKG